jgi:hypothetical protein
MQLNIQIDVMVESSDSTSLDSVNPNMNDHGRHARETVVVNVSDRIDHNGVKELTSAIAENIHDNVHELFLNRFGTTVRNVEFGEDQLCLNL